MLALVIKDYEFEDHKFANWRIFRFFKDILYLSVKEDFIYPLNVTIGIRIGRNNKLVIVRYRFTVTHVSRFE